MNKIRDRIPKHSYKGERWKTNTSNKKRLAEDFMHRCAYCDDHDHYSGGYNTYHVDHFAPKSKFKELAFVYENLMYSCPYCNAAKKDKWIGDNSENSVFNDEGYMYRELKLYLSRLSIIYQLDRIRLQRKRLKEKIDIKKKNGENTANLEEIYTDLCVIFSEYYEVFFENIN